MAKETHTYRESENLTTWQSTRTKRAFDDFDESVKRLKREFGLCDESDECTAEGNHETGKNFRLVWTNYRLKKFNF